MSQKATRSRDPSTSEKRDDMRLEQSERATQAALRGLAGLIARAKLDPEDVGQAGDLLLEAGFPEDTPSDTELLDAADRGRR